MARDPTLVQGDPFWRDTVWRTMADAQLMVVLWSRDAARSPWVDQEIRGFAGPRLFIALDDSPLPASEENALQADGVAITLTREIEASNQETRAASTPEPSGAEAEDPEAEVYWRRALEVQQAREELERFKRTMRRQGPQVAERGEGALRLQDGTEMLRLPGGTSKLGEYLAATPVTNRQFRRFIDETRYCPPPVTWNRDEFAGLDLPVVGVTWFEAAAHAVWAGGRLPTSQEWARAAIGGRPNAEFATWTGALHAGDAHFGVQPGKGAPVAAATHRPTPDGYAGMCGNTWDWCATPDGPHRVIRGGGYMDSARFCRMRAWYRNTPFDRDCCVGFRVLVETHP